MAETPPTNTAPELLPSLSSDTQTNLLDPDSEPVNFSGEEREAERVAIFLDFLPCMHHTMQSCIYVSRDRSTHRPKSPASNTSIYMQWKLC